MSLRFLKLVAVNVLVFVVLAEASGLYASYMDTGHFLYTTPRHYDAIKETAAHRLTADSVHPYFGPLHKPGFRPQSNNFGFTSPQAFPYEKRGADEFVIGIFGGSVGEQFCELGAPRLIEDLGADRALSGPSAPLGARRTFVPLCFSHEGYKQPQQLLVLAYFLSIGQRFDLVLNIDGLNEVALAALNNQSGRDISMPSPLHMDPLVAVIDQSTLTPERIESLAKINHDKESMNRLAARINANRIAMVDFVLTRIYARTRNEYQSELGRFANLPANAADTSIVELTRAVKARDDATLYEDIAASWANASEEMNAMLAARSVPYLHVLQPNQYFGTRRFAESEARIAINAASLFKAPVEKGYPVLLRQSARLRQSEHFIDATAVFDHESGAVYKDDCCHYTELGNRLLADAIAARVRELGAHGQRPQSSH